MEAASAAASGSTARDDRGGAVCYASRMEPREPPEFGPNGAVMNNPAMGDELRRDYRGEAAPPSLRPRAARDRLLAHVFAMLSFQMLIWIQLRDATLTEQIAMSVLATFICIRPFWPVHRIERLFWRAAILGLCVYSMWVLMR